MCSRLPSRFKKCGYCRENDISRSVSSNPLGGNNISLDLSVRLLLCILTAIDMDARSEPSGRNTTNLDSFKEHSLEKHTDIYYLCRGCGFGSNVGTDLGMQFDGVLSTSHVAKNFIGTGLDAPAGVKAPAPVIVLINLSDIAVNVTFLHH